MARHGTLAGYELHRRQDSPVCARCKRARNQYQQYGDTTPAPTRTVLDTGWMTRSACLGISEFPDWPYEQQQPYCQACPVASDCLEFGLAQSEIVKDCATYGGLTGRDLIEERRRRRAAAAAQLGEDGFELEPSAAAVAYTMAPAQLRVSASLPHVVERRLALIEDVTDMLGAGETPVRICARLGRSADALVHALVRAGHPELAAHFYAETNRP